MDDDNKGNGVKFKPAPPEDKKNAARPNPVATHKILSSPPRPNSSHGTSPARDNRILLQLEPSSPKDRSLQHSASSPIYQRCNSFDDLNGNKKGAKSVDLRKQRRSLGHVLRGKFPSYTEYHAQLRRKGRRQSGRLMASIRLLDNKLNSVKGIEGLSESDFKERTSAMNKNDLVELSHRMFTSLNQYRRLLSVSSLMTGTSVSEDTLQEIINSTYKVINCERVSLFLVDNQAKVLRIVCSQDAEGVEIPLDSGIAGHVATTMQMLIVDDAYKDARFNSETDKKTGFVTRNMMVAPIVSGEGTCIAVVQAINKRDDQGGPAEFAAETDSAILSYVATAAATCLEKSNVATDAFAARAKSELLVRAIKVTTKEVGDDSIKDIYGLIYQALHCQSVTMYALNKASNELREVMQDTELGTPFRCGEGLVGWTALHQTSLSVADAKSDPRFREDIESPEGQSIKSVLCCPIVDGRKEIIGVMRCCNRIEDGFNVSRANERIVSAKVRPFRNADLELVGAVCHELAPFLRQLMFTVYMKSNKSKRVKSLLSSYLTPRRKNTIFRSKFSFSIWTLTVRAVGKFALHLKRIRRKKLLNARKKTIVNNLKKRNSMIRRVQSYRMGDVDKHQMEGTVPDNLHRVVLLARKSQLTTFDLDDIVDCANSVASTDSDDESWPNKGKEEAEKTYNVAQELYFEENFNVLEYSDTANLKLVVDAFGYMGLVEKFRIPQDVLHKFIDEIRLGYDKSLSYHNWQHATCVFHQVYSILTASKAGEHLFYDDILSLLISAICHDVGHRGRTNDFEIKAHTSLAIRYNDASILENMHAAITFETMQRDGCDVLRGLSKAKFFSVRRNIIEHILGTDMKSHFKQVEWLGNKRKEKLSRDNETDRRGFSKYLLHCCDIGAQCYEPEVSQMWEKRVLQEFLDQAESERSRGLEVTPHMSNLDSVESRVKVQIGFVKFVVLPAWLELCAMLPSVENPYLHNLRANLEIYNERLNAATMATQGQGDEEGEKKKRSEGKEANTE